MLDVAEDSHESVVRGGLGNKAKELQVVSLQEMHSYLRCLKFKSEVQQKLKLILLYFSLSARSRNTKFT